jgi:4'-phosphopantetheinyl transferase
MESCCSPEEMTALSAVPAALRARCFLQVWTRKEAVLKAWGTGIGTIPLRELQVGIDAELLPGRTGAPTGPALRLRSLVSENEVLSIAAATALPFELRMNPTS